jgi:acetyl-CoA carboxylase alpha subunit
LVNTDFTHPEWDTLVDDSRLLKVNLQALNAQKIIDVLIKEEKEDTENDKFFYKDVFGKVLTQQQIQEKREKRKKFEQWRETKLKELGLMKECYIRPPCLVEKEKQQ